MLNTLAKIAFLFILCGMLFTSCYKKADIENTATVDMAGEWFVQYFEEVDPATPITNYVHFLTYNTSENNASQLWVDDVETWPLKAKIGIDYASMSFPETASAENIATAGTNIRVLEGKILKQAAKSQSGNIVDSIFLRIEFLDEEPGNIYQIRGHTRTGFFEDEY